MGETIHFEFGETNAANDFWGRNRAFWPAFERLRDLTNKCFGRDPHAANAMQNIVFQLGQTCRQDFLELAFLAVNGHGLAAQKLLRPLYERAVTLEYIRQNPEKAEKFERFARIQEFKAANRALAVVSRAQFDAEMARSGISYELLERNHDEVKAEFKVTKCERCGIQLPSTWDIDFASMVQRVGDPYKQLFLVCYTLPNFQIHATLASAFSRPLGEAREERSIHDAELSLISGTLIFVAVLESQNKCFSLPFTEDIRACQDDVSLVWKDRPHGPLAKRGSLTTEAPQERETGGVTESEPKSKVVDASVIQALTKLDDVHPVFHIDDPALQAHARRLAPLLAAARTHDERSPLDYLLGALHALFRARQLGFQDRTGPLDDEYWEGPTTRVRYMQQGDVRTDGAWLAGFYFNSALARIAAGFDRLVALVEEQSPVKEQPPVKKNATWLAALARIAALVVKQDKNATFRKRLQRIGWGKWKKPDFILGNGKTSKAYLVYIEVNYLKHHPEGLAEGREATMDDAITGLGEVIDLADQRVTFSGRGPGPPGP